MLRIAIQTKGRLNEQSMQLLKEAGVTIREEKRKFLMKAQDFPIEVLFLRDDDIPQTVEMGVADLGIVGYNELVEKNCKVEILKELGFGKCRLSLAIPKSESYTDLSYFNGKRIATSYPNILSDFCSKNNIQAKIHTINGSVEISPAAGMADAIFDIVSSGGTLVSNSLVEVERVLESQAILIGNPNMEKEKLALVEQLLNRFESIIIGTGKKYLLMNIPNGALEDAIKILPAMRSPTVIPLAQSNWSSLQTVVDEKDLWSIIEKMKDVGAEGILVLNLEKIVL